MKKLFTLFLGLLAAGVAEAQSIPAHFKFASQQGAAHAFVMQLLRNQVSSAAKTTLTKERLIASEYSTSNFRPSLNIYDSARYIYSGNNGSTFDLNELAYDFPKTQYDYDAPMLDLHRYHITRPNIMCDTAIGKNLDGSVYKPANTTIANYDANGTLLTYKSISNDTEYTPSLAYYNTYDGAGNVTLSISFNTPNGTSWDTLTKRYFTYNGSGQLIIDSMYTRNATTWYLASKYEYAYDGGGHLAQVKSYTRNGSAAPLLYKQVYDQTYYADGKLQTSYISVDTGTGMYVAYVDTFGYATGYDYFNFFNEFGYTDVGWRAISTFTKRINAEGVPDTAYKTVLISFYDTAGVLLGTQDLKFKDVIIYNTHNDPIEDDNYIFSGSSYHPNSQQVFYYEPATGVTKTPIAYTMKVYPNPVTDILSIVPGDALKNKNLVVQLTNMEGRVLSSLGVYWQGAAITIPIKDLALGVYYLSVSDAAGNSAKSEKIIKN